MTWQVPLNIAIRESGDAGAPIAVSSPASASAAAYQSIADRVREKLAAATKSGPRIVVE